MPFPPAPSLLPGARRTASRGAGLLPWLGLIASVGMAAVVTVFGTLILPPFAEMFANVGHELPLLSRTFAKAYLLAWLGPLVVLACWRFGPGPWASRLAGLLGMLLALLGAVSTLFALYLPYFQMGSLV